MNHKDGDSSNNTLSNLEWITHQDNIKHAATLGLIRNLPKLGQRGFQKLNTELQTAN